MALLSTSVVAGDIHKWKDENGNTHFGDKPPPSVETEQIIVKPNVYVSPSIERNESSVEGSGREIVMYSAEWCGYCKKARNYFTANNIRFKEYDVEKSRKGQRDYKTLKAKGVPVILIGNKRLNGFSESSFNSIYGQDVPGTQINNSSATRAGAALSFTALALPQFDSAF